MAKADYYEAIEFTKKLGQSNKMVLEGEARNIARRDGVGTIILDTVRIIGRMPDHYFQALGSGPGAIAAYEAYLRLRQDGRYGKKLFKIHGAQNFPFVPMYDAWQKCSKKIDKKYQEKSAKKLIKKVSAQVITNKFPCYAAVGGVYDALKATSGHFYSCNNIEAKKAQTLFKKTEGYNIGPEAGITVASLIQAIKQGTINKNDYVLVNITGGNQEQIKRNRFRVRPSMVVDKNFNISKILKSKSLFGFLRKN